MMRRERTGPIPGIRLRWALSAVFKSMRCEGIVLGPAWSDCTRNLPARTSRQAASSTLSAICTERGQATRAGSGGRSPEDAVIEGAVAPGCESMLQTDEGYDSDG